MQKGVEDLEKAIELARKSDLMRQQIGALNQLANLFFKFGLRKECLLPAQEALTIALEIGAPDLEAESRDIISTVKAVVFDYEAAENQAKLAIDLARKSGNIKVEANSLITLGWLSAMRDNNQAQAYKRIRQAVEPSQQIGDRTGLAKTLVVRQIISRDLVSNLYYGKQYLSLASEINHLPEMVNAMNNLSFAYWQFGLYYRAMELIEEAIHIERQSGMPVVRFHQVTLAECCLPLGQFDRLQQIVEQLIETSDGKGREFVQPLFVSGLGAYHSGDYERAIKELQIVAKLAPEVDEPGTEATTLAWLGAAELAAGRPLRAQKYTADAVSLSTGPTYYSPQEIYWWHYKTSLGVALRPAQGKLSGEWSKIPGQARDGRDSEALLPDELFEILDKACRLMLDFVAGIGDEGLRRNYLNKVAINSDITVEWIKRAAARGESLAPFTERETETASFEEQFQRLVETGNRLTAERDPTMLPDTIRNEFVELSGAERAIVALRDEEGKLHWASTQGFEEDDPEETAVFLAPFLHKVRDIRAPILRESEGVVPEGEVSELHLRSLIALPLVSQGKVWGVLYGDMRHIFGRFTEQDLALLNILANQAAAALENANWVRGLEPKVEERTAELNARVSELQIINSIQAGSFFR